MLTTLAVIAALAVTASAQTWQTLASNIGTAATGIDFTSTTHGYVPADVNGEGTACLITDDGGKTWTSSGDQEPGLIWLDVAAYETNVVVSGAVDEYYSLNSGTSFNVSIGGGQAQSIETMMQGGKEIGYIAAGDFGLIDPKSGVALSTDSGVIFSAESADLKTDARYVSYVDGVIYLTGGSWPGEDDDSSSSSSSSNDDPFSNDDNNFAGNLRGTKRPRSLQLAERFGFHFDGEKGDLRAMAGVHGAGSGNYTCEVSKSTDGGKTWTQLFWSEGVFYPNGIAAWDPDHACFVGEADSGSAPGTRIWCTDDGKTFNQTYTNPGAANSMMDIAIVPPASNGEAWAVGGELTSSPSAQFYHTTDFGKTWTAANTISGSYATSIDCVDAQHCWATTLQPLFQTASVAGLSTD